MKKKVCAAMVFVFTAVMASGCVKKEEIQKYSHVDYAMGTVTNTTLYGRSPDLSETEQAIMEKMKKLETEQLSWRKGNKERRMSRSRCLPGLKSLFRLQKTAKGLRIRPSAASLKCGILNPRIQRHPMRIRSKH